MGWFKRKFNKIKRTDIVDAICELEKQQQELMDEIQLKQQKKLDIIKLGKAEKNRDMQIFYAKKVAATEGEITLSSRRLTFLHQNVSAMNQLKLALDDRDFIKNNSRMPLNQLLNNPAELQKFLAGIIDTKMLQEGKLEETMNVFNTANDSYVESSTIYGENEDTNRILAMFESEKQIEDEQEMYAPGFAAAEKSKIKEE